MKSLFFLLFLVSYTSCVPDKVSFVITDYVSNNGALSPRHGSGDIFFLYDLNTKAPKLKCPYTDDSASLTLVQEGNKYVLFTHHCSVHTITITAYIDYGVFLYSTQRFNKEGATVISGVGSEYKEKTVKTKPVQEFRIRVN
jgi:hypothetical protein